MTILNEKRKVYFFLCCSSSELHKFIVVVHRDCSAPRRLSILSPLWVQHPPGAFSSPLILETHKAAMQRQIVSDGVL